MSHPKHADSPHQILDVIRRRWSPRAFDPARAVPADDLRTIFEAARWAPSSFNEQPWRFVVASRQTSLEAFSALMETLEPANREWARHAPVLILVAVSLRTAGGDRVSRTAWYDAGQAVGFLTLQATELGLAIRQMEGFRRDAARDVCGVPDDYEPLVVMALGYAGDPETLAAERHRAAERRPRKRLAVEEFVFEGYWGKRLR